MNRLSLKSAFARGAAMAGCLVLSGCFLTPGQFDAEMDIRNSGDFTFTYDGEVLITGMNDLSEMANAAEMAEDCYDEDTYESRPCTAKELDDRASEQAQERAMMQAMMGSVDMSDPESAEEFAANLERQAGWTSVVHRGDGVFDVNFAISSRLGHDFAFPTLEGFPFGNAFVTAAVRKDNRVRIDAAGFAVQAGNPMQAMMLGGLAMADAQEADGKAGGGKSAPGDMPQMRGTFRVITDGEILANNTEEGPQTVAGGQALVWNITPGNTAAPTALIRLNP